MGSQRALNAGYTLKAGQQNSLLHQDKFEFKLVVVQFSQQGISQGGQWKGTDACEKEQTG